MGWEGAWGSSQPRRQRECRTAARLPCLPAGRLGIGACFGRQVHTLLAASGKQRAAPLTRARASRKSWAWSGPSSATACEETWAGRWSAVMAVAVCRQHFACARACAKWHGGQAEVERAPLRRSAGNNFKGSPCPCPTRQGNPRQGSPRPRPHQEAKALTMAREVAAASQPHLSTASASACRIMGRESWWAAAIA